MLICTECGKLKASNKGVCPSCSAKYLNKSKKGIDVSVVKGKYGFLNCKFDCKSCGFEVYLNHLDTDGAVRCNSCGVEQKFKIEKWIDILNRAHFLLDCYFSSKEISEIELGISNQHKFRDYLNDLKRCGTDKNNLKFNLEDDQFGEIKISITPGNPLCNKCGGVLKISKYKLGILTTQCSECSDEKQYENPQGSENIMNILPPICVDHRVGKIEAKIESNSESGALAITCPNCFAALEEPKENNFIKCQYCETTSYVSPKALGLKDKENINRGFWLFFIGDSQEYRNLLGLLKIIRKKQDAKHQKIDKFPELTTPKSKSKSKSSIVGPIVAFLVALLIPAIIVGAILITEKSNKKSKPDNVVGSLQLKFKNRTRVFKYDHCMVLGDYESVMILNPIGTKASYYFTIRKDKTVSVRVHRGNHIYLLKKKAKISLSSETICKNFEYQLIQNSKDEDKPSYSGFLKVDCKVKVVKSSFDDSHPTGWLKGEVKFKNCKL